MVSQTQNEEWENSSTKNGSTLSLNYRQHPSVIRTPPSYFDAVRSRHSLSQPDSMKPEKPLSPQQVKYNSLPRPLPQRLQTYPQNIYDVQQKPVAPWTDGHQNKILPEKSLSRPVDTMAGFQVYTRPPGPANHVPLIPTNQMIRMPNGSSSLPRCFPRDGGKMEFSTPNISGDIHQPLSIIVKPDYANPPISKQENFQRDVTRANQVQMPPPQGRKQQMSTQHSTQHQPLQAMHPTQHQAMHSTQHQPLQSMHLTQHQSLQSLHSTQHQPLQSMLSTQHQPLQAMNGQNRMNTLPRNMEKRGQISTLPYKRDAMMNRHPAHPSYHYPDNPNYPRYSKNGTLPFQHPRRDYIIEPAISIRTGPLGSYPDPQPVNPNHLPPKSGHTSMSQNLLECADMPFRQENIRRSKPPNMEPPASVSNHLSPVHSTVSSRTLSPPTSNRMNHYSEMPNSLCNQQRHHASAFSSPEQSKSSTLPRKNSREKAIADFNVISSNSYATERPAPHPSVISSKQYSARVPSPKKLYNHNLLTPVSDQHFIQKTSDDDSITSSTPSKGPICETPEEVGLVMIVESRDMNNRINGLGKDVVKPTPRMALSPAQTLSVHNSEKMQCFPVTNQKSHPMSPSTDFNSHIYDYCSPNGNGRHLKQSSSISSEDIRSPLPKNFSNGDMFRAVPSTAQPIATFPSKAQNGFLLRRTPLSSSTASLNSEISSLSSRNRRMEENPKRTSSSQRRSSERNDSSDDKEKMNEISPSPWVREEKEQLQKQQLLGARKARDEEIAYLESLPNRTDKQEEWLRILRLEREFQKRAEEMDDDEEEEEDDEVLLERAEYRERMLMMQKKEETSKLNSLPNSPNKYQSNIYSSSDQWLTNSQAKQPKRYKDIGANLSLNGNFEVEQLNDLLETMNMSPVIRPETDDNSDGQELSPYGKRYQETTETFHNTESASINKGFHSTSQLQTKPIPAPRMSKSLSPDPHKTFNGVVVPPLSVAENSQKCVDSCAIKPSIRQPFLTGLPFHCDEVMNGSKVMKPDYNNETTYCKTASRDRSASNNSQKIKSLSSSDAVTQPEEPEYSNLRFSSKFSSVNNKDSSPQYDVKKSQTSFETSAHKVVDDYLMQKIITNGESHGQASRLQDFRNSDKGSYLSPLNYRSAGRLLSSESSLGSLYSPVKNSNGVVKEETNTDLEGKTSEYRKIWNSKPEKLTFMDKIRKFSLQAGDDVPKDKVKNSRAQRELEMKFNGDINAKVKPIEVSSGKN